MNHFTWTTALLELLYERVALLFGPYSTWESPDRPGHGKNEDYLKFCSAFALANGPSSGTAVEMKIKHATTFNFKSGVAIGQYAREIGLALAVGFIDYDVAVNRVA